MAIIHFSLAFEESYFTINGSRGHLDGVISMKQAEGAVKAFLEK